MRAYVGQTSSRALIEQLRALEIGEMTTRDERASDFPARTPAPRVFTRSSRVMTL
jgi:hypothetical protein